MYETQQTNLQKTLTYYTNTAQNCCYALIFTDKSSFNNFSVKAFVVVVVNLRFLKKVFYINSSITLF